MRHFVLLLLWIISQVACGQPHNVIIDGIISFNEKLDTAGFRILPVRNEDFLIKMNRDYVYAGIRNSTVAATNVILYKGDQIIVIHLSACTGRAVYSVKGDSVMVVKPILSVVQHPEAWDVVGAWASHVMLGTSREASHVEECMRSCLSRFGYMGSTIDMGSYREAEVILDRKVFKGFKMLLQNTVLSGRGNEVRHEPSFYPENGYGGSQQNLAKFLEAAHGTRLHLELETKTWIVL